MQNNKELHITAIVPVFNEERFLKNSISRLINENVVQKILIVDDSSTDNSLFIIKELSDAYEFVQYFENLHYIYLP